MNKDLVDLTNAIELPTDTLSAQDADIREIFIEEVQEILEFLQEALPQWVAEPGNHALLTDIRRSFHTLKGSGRMAGAKTSGELAWAIEEMLNRLISGTISLSEEIQELVFSVMTLYQYHLVNDFGTRDGHQVDVRPFILTAQRLRDGRSIDPVLQWTITYYQSQHIPTAAELDELTMGSSSSVPTQPVENIDVYKSTEAKDLTQVHDTLPEEPKPVEVTAQAAPVDQVQSSVKPTVEHKMTPEPAIEAVTPVAQASNQPVEQKVSVPPSKPSGNVTATQTSSAVSRPTQAAAPSRTSTAPTSSAHTTPSPTVSPNNEPPKGLWAKLMAFIRGLFGGK